MTFWQALVGVTLLAIIVVAYVGSIVGLVWLGLECMSDGQGVYAALCFFGSVFILLAGLAALMVAHDGEPADHADMLCRSGHERWVGNVRVPYKVWVCDVWETP